jgi:DNA-binding response OmpR family regulator
MKMRILSRVLNPGSVDYICKPFKTQELLARVHTHLNLVLTRKALQKANDELVLVNEMKSEFLGIACHDLKKSIVRNCMARRFVEGLDPKL